jgi:hypothetical protein
LLALPAYANTITVADGEVVIADNGICSLREAIVNANLNTNAPGSGGHDDCAAGSGADTIQLAAHSTYTLTDVDNTNAGVGNSGLPEIIEGSDITLQGNGRSSNETRITPPHPAAIPRLSSVSS